MKDGRRRVYSLSDAGEGAVELWVEADQRKGASKARKLVTIEPADVGPFLDDVERELRVGGWMKA